MKKTAFAPANIAFIKYWGKADNTLRTPLNSSLSMNLSGSYTTTTIEFSRLLSHDQVTLLGGDFSQDETERVIDVLERIRQKVNSKLFARVVTKNTFPKGAGAAASASGFAALTVAGFAAAGMLLSEKDLTIYARMASGSACRSIPDGFVVWEKGNLSEESYAYSIYPYTYWDLRDILVIVDSRMKKVATTRGMETVKTSPYISARLAKVEARLIRLKKAIDEKNFALFGNITEEDCLDMHHVMQTQNPPLLYWNDMTRVLMKTVRFWRKNGLPVYYTIDAGPNVHVLCEADNEKRVLQELQKIDNIESVIVNKPSAGAHLVATHLF